MEIELEPLKSLDLPDSWRREDSYARGPRIRFFAPGESDLCLVILKENRSVSEASLGAFNLILQKQANSAKTASEVQASEIISVREVLGTAAVGDNQYCNKHRHPDPRSPAFNLASAQVLDLNGRKVLQVKGSFMDQDGVPSNYTHAIFVACSFGQILKVFMQTTSQDEFIMSTKTFGRIISSVCWQS